MKQIERYIQFARNNKFEFYCPILEEHYGNNYEFYIENNEIIITAGGECFNGLNIIEVITSKPFIEAVARGLPNGVGFQSPFCTDVDKITWKQAESIRENKLPEFIDNLLGE